LPLKSTGAAARPVEVQNGPAAAWKPQFPLLPSIGAVQSAQWQMLSR
jgi:hypothetical protein